MKMITILAIFTSSAAFAAPCPQSLGISCTVNNSGMPSCIEPTSAIPTDAFSAQCTSSGGIFSASACSAASKVGSCSLGQRSLTMHFYAPMPANYVEMICTQAQGTVCQ